MKKIAAALALVFMLVFVLIAAKNWPPKWVSYQDDPNDFTEFRVKTKWVKSAKELPEGTIYILQRPELIYLVSEDVLVDGPTYLSRFYWDGKEFRERHTNKRIPSQRVVWDNNRTIDKLALYFYLE